MATDYSKLERRLRKAKRSAQQKRQRQTRQRQLRKFGVRVILPQFDAHLRIGTMIPKECEDDNQKTRRI